MEAEAYRARRESLMDELGEGLALVPGGSAGEPGWNFFYLTGIREPRAWLLLAPAGARVGMGRSYPGPDYVRGRLARQVLFLPSADPMAARWGEDSAVTVEGADAAALGVDAVQTTSDLDAVLFEALRPGTPLHFVRSAPATLSGPDGTDVRFVENLRRRLFGVRVSDATPAVEEMRRLKDEGEIAKIQRSVDLTAEAMGRVMRMAKPGVPEYRVEAEITRTYRSENGVHAFDPIVGSGPNAVSLHYKDNLRTIGRGELVLVDTGVSLDGYKSDITRTFPADGRFTERQREVYGVVLRALEEVVEATRPGVLLGDLHAKAHEVIEAAGHGEHFVHGVGHFLGLETHDVGDRHRPLEPGAVFTVEPGVYIPDEGLGVRIEDVVLVTANGSRVLSRSIPRTVEDIESLMASGQPS